MRPGVRTITGTIDGCGVFHRTIRTGLAIIDRRIDIHLSIECATAGIVTTIEGFSDNCIFAIPVDDGFINIAGHIDTGIKMINYRFVVLVEYGITVGIFF